MHGLVALLLMNRQLTNLAPVDVLILVLYFALVVFIGFYAKGKANTSEDFFLAGREMTAWIAGLASSPPILVRLN
jgi:SSS family solute:Na+ symporter